MKSHPGTAILFPVAGRPRNEPVLVPWPIQRHTQTSLEIGSSRTVSNITSGKPVKKSVKCFLSSVTSIGCGTFGELYVPSGAKMASQVSRPVAVNLSKYALTTYGVSIRLDLLVVAEWQEESWGASGRRRFRQLHSSPN